MFTVLDKVEEFKGATIILGLLLSNAFVNGSIEHFYAFLVFGCSILQ
jgi:hypothetical protein